MRPLLVLERGVLFAQTVLPCVRVVNVEETWGVVITSRKESNRDPETGRITFFNADKPFPSIKELTLMFVEKHGRDPDGVDLYHRIGMENRIDEAKTVNWPWVDERLFRVGGPGRGDRVRFGVGERGPVRDVASG